MLTHVAVIMDGNGRWALARGKNRLHGHQRGVEITQNAIKCFIECDIKYLTMYVFSAENWQRPKEEVNYLMQLLSSYLKKNKKFLHDNEIRMRAIGEISKLPFNISDEVAKIKDETKHYNKLNLTLAINYGGQQEILRSCKQLVKSLKNRTDNEIDNFFKENKFEESLYTRDLPDPDVIVRTGGEQRLSNFLLWQSAYSELIFLKKYWPDFDKDDVDFIIKEYSSRKRNYGKI